MTASRELKRGHIVLSRIPAVARGSKRATHLGGAGHTLCATEELRRGLSESCRRRDDRKAPPIALREPFHAWEGSFFASLSVPSTHPTIAADY